MQARRVSLISLLLAGMFMLMACESSEDRASGYLASAEQLFADGDVVKAEIEVKNALQIQPKNAKARFLLARIDEDRREYQDMASNLRIAIEADPEYTDARIKLGMLYTMGGASELAEEQVNKLTVADRERTDARILLARIAATNGDTETAVAELETALRQDPSNIQALGLLASISAATDLEGALELIDRGIADADDPKPLRMLRIQLLQQAGNRQAEVEQALRGLMQDYPDEPAFGYQLARYLATEGRIDEVEPVLQEIVRNDPENTEARLALVQFIASTKGADEAEQLLVTYVEESPESYQLGLVLGRLYQQQGRPDDAYAAYERVADAAGKEDEGLVAKARMAGIDLTQGDNEKGEALIEEVLSIDSLNAEALLLRSVVNIEKEDFRGAVSDLREILRVNPENRQAQLLLARAHSRAGDVVLAEDAYRRVLGIDPGNVQATLEYANLLVTRDKQRQAEAVLTDQLEAFPQEVRFSRAFIALQVANEKYSSAETEARRVVAVEGQEGIGYFLLGGIYQARGDDQQAVDAFKQSLQYSPLAREPLRGMAASLVRLDRADEAIAYLTQLQEEYPDNLYAKTLLGQLLAGSGDLEAAEQVLQSTLDANESWLPAYTALAGLQSGDVAAQISTYKKGLAAVPDSQELVLLLGTAYERSGRVEDAIASYEEALAANPEMPAVANNLAALIADYRTDSGSLKRALEIAGQFRNSGNPAFLDTLGWVYYRMGDYDEAVPLLEKSVEAAGQVAVLRYHLGMAYVATGKPTLAKEQLEAALADENADFVGVEEARAALAEL